MRRRLSARALKQRAAGAARELVWVARREPRGRCTAAREAGEQRTGPREWRLSVRALKPADGVWGHRKRGGREAPEHWTGPQN